MTETDVHSFLAQAELEQSPDAYLCSLREASRTDNGKYCLESGYASGIRAIHFDGVLSEWHNVPARLKAGRNAPTRIDGLYVDGRTFYLVEFKRKKLEQLEKDALALHRKLYDSVIGLLTHGYKTLAQCCEEIVYVVVATGVPRISPDDMRLSHSGGLTPTQSLLVRRQIFNSLPDCVHRPWHYPQVRAHFGLYKLEDVICQRVLTLTPQQFNRFVKEKGWS